MFGPLLPPRRSISAVDDHGALNGLEDDDHPQYVQGVATGYRLARGIHTQTTATDTVVTGLTTVVAVVASFETSPTVKQWLCSATIGDQAGTPAAGSVILKTWKPTAVNDATPTAATDFTGTPKVSWVAVGT